MDNLEFICQKLGKCVLVCYKKFAKNFATLAKLKLFKKEENTFGLGTQNKQPMCYFVLAGGQKLLL